MSQEPEIGAPAPDFTLPGHLGADVTLSALRGTKVLLGFYIFDFSPGWVIELVSWKERYERIKELGGEILAVSVDHIFAHRAWAASLAGVPFPLLADWSKEVARSYGVLNEQRGNARRSVFVVDGTGVIRYKNTAFDARKLEDYEAAIGALASL